MTGAGEWVGVPASVPPRLGFVSLDVARALSRPGRAKCRETYVRAPAGN